MLALAFCSPSTPFLFLSPDSCTENGEKEKFEAYRELGTALHTLEDFLAHCV